jgi:exosortase D (VPLPA-CTERM-specific)
MKKIRIKPLQALLIGLYVFLFGGIYHSTLRYLVTNDWEREGFSYGYLIPFIVAYLIWIKKDELQEKVSRPAWIGILPLLLGLFFYWLGELGGEFMTLYLSMWLVVVGLGWIHLGWAKLKVIWFPFFYMLSMFPPPAFIIANLTLKLQLIASKLGTGMIDLLGIPVFLEGNVIQLEYTKLQVVEACSGLNSLISLLVLSLLLAYFFKDHLWKRTTLFFSSIPLAIFLNATRITLTAVLYKYFGQVVADGFFHNFSGLVIFLVSIPTLFLELWFLQKLPPIARKTTESMGPRKDESFKKTASSLTQARVLRPQFGVAVLLMGITLVLSTRIDFQEKTPILKPFSAFPLAVAEWTTRGMQAMDKIYLDTLDLSDYLIADYYNPRRQSVNLYVAYYASQSKGKSIHSPTTCLPGGGWKINQTGTIALEVSKNPDRPLRVNRAVMQLGKGRQVAYYWFSQRGRVLTNAYQLKIYNFIDSIKMQRTDGALVRIITTIGALEKLEDADERLKKFIREMNPVLNEFIPG